MLELNKDYNSVADEIDRLRELKQNALVESAEREGLKQRIREMREFLEQQSTEVTEDDELQVRRLIEKVTVYDGRFEVEFKSGAKVDVERQITCSLRKDLWSWESLRSVYWRKICALSFPTRTRATRAVGKPAVSGNAF